MNKTIKSNYKINNIKLTNLNKKIKPFNKSWKIRNKIYRLNYSNIKMKIRNKFRFCKIK